MVWVIREALDPASPAMVLRMFVQQGLALAGIGVACGMAAALWLTGLMASLLFEVKPADPLTYGAVAGVLILAAVAAAWFPARRATAVEPISALRAE